MVSYSALVFKDFARWLENTSDSFPESFQGEGHIKANRSEHIDAYKLNTYKIKYVREITVHVVFGSYYYILIALII